MVLRLSLFWQDSTLGTSGGSIFSSTFALLLANGSQPSGGVSDGMRHHCQMQDAA